MIERVQDELCIWPRKPIGATGYGSAEMLAWPVHERDIEPHIPVIDNRTGPTLPFRAPTSPMIRSGMSTCPSGKLLTRLQRPHWFWTSQPHADGFFRYRASKADCDGCALKPQCCSGADPRKAMRSVYEGARSLARFVARDEECLVSER
jgi:hypothetical protein